MHSDQDMSEANLSSAIIKFVCTRIDASQILSVHIMQNLWGGQGKLLRVRTNSIEHPSCILKHVSLDRSAKHPRGWSGQVSHQRKARSYRVECLWYEQYANQCHDACRVPQTLGTHTDTNGCLILLEDLSPEYPLLCSDLSISEVHVCLKWLAEFHARFLNHPGEGLWEEGCYWHLSTRPDEYEAMKPGAVKDAAKAIDEKLRLTQFQTLVHGDAKLANFCFNDTKTQVAAVDFQYVGRGCGMKDVAYFLGSCLSDTQCARHEEELLDVYFHCLRNAIAQRIDVRSIEALEAEWRYLYSFAWTDFYRFLLGWMPTHTKINSYTLALCERSLSEL